MTVETANGPIHLKAYGDRITTDTRAVLLLPGARGFPADPSLEQFAQMLAHQGHFAVMVDYYRVHPGQQNRTSAARDLWVELVTVTAAAVRRQGLAPADVYAVGYSLGGWVAAYAGLTTADVEAVITVAAGEDVGSLPKPLRHPRVCLLAAREDPVVSDRSVSVWQSRLVRAGVDVRRARLSHQGHGLSTRAWSRAFAVISSELDYFASQRAMASPHAP